MGICFSAKSISENDDNTGHAFVCAGVKNSKDDNDSSNINDNGSASSKISLASALPVPRSEGEISQSSNLKSFSLAELKEATRNFCPDSVLGVPASGSVFKGWIDEHSFTATKPGTGLGIAVKRLHRNSFRGRGDWFAEVNFLGQLVHSHLVKLIGYCLEDEQQLIVSELMPRGSLDNHLFLRGSYFQPLSWALRLKVALGAAKGLAFLHSDERKVIFRDLRTSIILLDSDYNAKLSDLGFSKTPEKQAVRAMSLPGLLSTSYAAPEYLTTGQATTSSDVYSFGVILLEMLSGRRAIDKNRPFREHNLIEWARPYLANERKSVRIIDDRLEGQYSLDAAYKLSSLTLQCLSIDPKSRPSMNEVVIELEQLQDATSINSNRTSTRNRMARRHSADDANTLRSARARPWPPPISPDYS
ncbi:probable serine/threonine-protein kinase PBL9 isoform X1 [Cucurbita pepo subsp. pepo]|uniref:probable serine/threonine-protein kinase PBL9 isoform X1 n=1 Tax=Cucurbita pepo subsp. pepo TaxID=3664 RepID=UPI000C9D5E0D|nr:probable serine/threonine-protein kinase PBL9 isoform X1 [Cucurbita pepo subsp. pepo]